MASFQTPGFQTGNRPGGGEYRQRGVRHQNHMGHGSLTRHACATDCYGVVVDPPATPDLLLGADRHV